MDLATILIGLALILLVGAYLARPLLDRTAVQLTPVDHERSALLAGRERVLAAMEELDMDRTMGKLDEEDYLQQRAELLGEGADVLRRLDQLVPAADPVQTTTEPADLAIADEIERQIEQLRAKSKATPGGAFCTACGQKILAGDRYCTQCGEPLQ